MGMMFSRIQIKNWKNFRDVDVRLNTRMFIIGPNAAGKSNFLDTFNFLSDIANDGLEKAVNSRNGVSALRCLAARKVTDISIKVWIDDAWIYELVIEGKKGAAPRVEKEVVKRKLETKTTVILNRPDKEDKSDPERLTQTALEQVNANKSFREIATFFKSISYRHILPQVVRSPRDFSPVSVTDDPYGRDLVSQIWNTAPRTRHARLKKINDVLQVAVPQLSDLTVEMDQTTGLPHLVTRYQHWRLYGARQNEAFFSDGTLRLLALLWSLLETGGPLLLEEPELSLHDEIVRQLPAMFAKLDRGKKKTTRQIIVSTHSYAMLEDPGVGPGEILILTPGDNGTEVNPPEDSDSKIMSESGLSVAEYLLPKTNPRDATRLSLFDYDS
jgi:predicted ATPase